MPTENIYTIVGDPHAKLKNLDKLGKICDQVELLGNTCIWLGDMLDTKSIIQGRCLSFWLYYFSHSELQHIIIIGNHDRYNHHETGHSLEALSSLVDISLVNENRTFPHTPFYFIPYIHDASEFAKAVEAGPKDSVLFCHAEISDFDFGTGLLCSNSLKAAMFRKYKRVCSGHFHRYQTSGNLTYLGTPFSHSFGESNQTKYIATYDVEKDHLKLIPTNLPQHHTLEVDCDVTAQLTLEDPQDLYRIILVGTSANVEKFDQALIQDQHETNVIFIKKPTNLEVKLHDITELNSPEKQFTEWGAIHKVSEQALELGLSILGDVKC